MTDRYYKTFDSTVEKIWGDVYNRGADVAIAALDDVSCLYDRSDLLEAFEQRAISNMHRTVALHVNHERVAPEKMVMSAERQRRGIVFIQYVADALGDQADPLLKAFLSEADKLTEAQRGDYFELLILHAKAVTSVAEEAHRAVSAGNHSRLNKLAAGRKVPVVSRAPKF